VIPVVTPAEMAAIDADAPEPVDVLVERAGSAVAWAARRMLGGTYGRVVYVLAGKGNNGADGRVAAARLEQWGATVRVIEADRVPAELPPCDLVIDAAYGTGFRGEWRAPRAGSAPVLAVDIPSGVDGRTGDAVPGVLPADRTVTFAALKPGLLFGAGRTLAGDIEVADIGLDTSRARVHLVEPGDVARWWRPRPPTAHKWSRAVRVVAGGPGMTGAAHLAAGGAIRAGAGIVWLSSPGVEPDAPREVVRRRLPAFDWAKGVLDDLHRFRSLVLGPGLGREDYTVESVRATLLDADTPVVLDGDGLFAAAWNADGSARVLRRRRSATVLTPHDGEYGLLTGHRPATDRVVATRRLASDTRCVALLKGPTTVVADPDGEVLVIAAGDARLASAGTGDVLAGIIGALLATGMEPLHAAASAAWIHGAAALLGPSAGFVAGDLLDHLPTVLERLE
jgi:NAD(P)H-hydrate epimerase